MLQYLSRCLEKKDMASIESIHILDVRKSTVKQICFIKKKNLLEANISSETKTPKQNTEQSRKQKLEYTDSSVGLIANFIKSQGI